MTRLPLPQPTLLSPALLSLALLAGCSQSRNEAVLDADLATVQRGDLVISVKENASVRAARQTRVRNEMEGRSTVIYLIAEGTRVTKGTRIVELDASQQVDRQATQKISVEKARASVTNAEKQLEILKDEIQSQNEAAANTVLFAKMDIEKFYGKELANGEREMGEQEQAIKAEEAEIKLAKSQLKLAQDRFDWSVKLREMGFITKEELEKDELDLQSKQTRVTLAENKLDILRKYTHRKTEAELKQALRDAKLEERRTAAKGEAQLIQEQADLAAKKQELELATEQLENLQLQIKNAVVKAPTDGIVVYAYEGDSRRRRYIEEGAEVRERQTMVILPDTSKMLAELSIQEAKIGDIRLGLPAQITSDTLGKVLTGTVTRRAPLADSASRWGNPDLKVYKTEVTIDGDNADGVLRPNMGVEVEIFIASLEDVLYIPIAATNYDDAVTYVWVPGDQGPEYKIVKLGKSNDTHVHVIEGLKENEQVYLAPPDGVITPRFEQPERPSMRQLPPLPDGSGPATAALKGAGEAGKPKAEDAQMRGRPREGTAPGNERRQGGGMSAMRAAIEKRLAEVKPELLEIYKANPRGAFRNQEIREFMRTDPELKKLFSGMRRGGNRGARGGEEGGRRGRRRGGEGEGEGRPRRNGGDGNEDAK